ncbi:30S ribosomal protein S12 methylthiotransferase RimO [Clostridium botulinum]|uniref:Ribosomal protein uS12 methylthiotransferase RimO n=2 Tax=Clostridium botulinum TaxID=1491 RepID=A0A846I483_CLOBO|nr:30S ribosomal protein S12 methylthiotransferase RimO [Clostridium botulinum]AJD28994.1 ribosomal protein S12 methylthiotransferase RimO [Clostridium botulinum CDC_297]ACQ51749.1 RNA modification enzyme, MiaB family [Clostridium botulinum Ba4 str. 657]AJE11494.1 ribosomal protein S12 methylthiotransferase RimO [Clostridium botulinum CDC_1436]APU61348.1 ribosomal protein S12 methylthiotransferase RimO [Clostridium botulinum]AUN03813.1 ribosomal protein S12 methylthiotransferase RimO [Clostrid
MEKIKVALVSLGCDKNRIDSELMLYKLNEEAELVKDPKEAQVIIVNTCGFIETAKEESINTILQMASYKKTHNCKVLVVTGCLTQRYKGELKELIPEMDIMLGVNDYDKLLESIKVFLKSGEKSFYHKYSDTKINEGNRILTTPTYTAYVRIAEGCNNFCTYCAIPRIRGKYRSRKKENILKEVENLAKQGVKEIILIAQDTTMYGIDIYGKKVLHELLRDISKVKGVKWIRLLYCYPEEITNELIEEIKSNDKVCKYLDLPIQQISNSVLKRMGRKTTKETIINIIKKLRKEIEGITLRTSLIVGFPGETEGEFSELKEFVSDIKLDKLGVFKYSKEEGTSAALMEEQIDEEIKEKREEEIMILQQSISKDINKEKIGKIYEVIVEGTKEDMYYGRNYEMSPEIDGEICFEKDENVKIGDIIKVKVTHSLEYDLIGVVYNELSK